MRALWTQKKKKPISIDPVLAALRRAIPSWDQLHLSSRSNELLLVFGWTSAAGGNNHRV